MTTEQILEDAISAGFSVQPDIDQIYMDFGIGCRHDITKMLTKFAELTKARAGIGKALAIMHRNEYDEYRLEPADDFKIKSIPPNVDIPLYALANQWIDCSVELPEEYQPVLVFRVRMGRGVGSYFIRPDGEKYWAIDGKVASKDWMEYPTHWQHLPLPPNAQQERN